MILIIYVISLLQLVYGLSPGYSLINCTWPCSNPTDKCVITTNSASCQPLIGSSWVVNAPNKAPIYTGPTATAPAQSCISVPIPQLPPANQSANIPPNTGQSIIYWPIVNTTRRVQDDYLGNCGRSLYCYHSTCLNRLVEGSPCNSSNQCAFGFCNNSTCHSLPGGHHGNKHSDPKATVAIVASVFGVVGAIALAGLIYRFRSTLFKTKKQTNFQPTVDKSKQDLVAPPPPYEP